MLSILSYISQIEGNSSTPSLPHQYTANMTQKETQMSKNAIIQALLKEYRKRNEINDTIPDETAFEYFVNYCVLSVERTMEGDFDDCITDRGEEGIDSIAILVNGKLVSNNEDIDEVAKHNTDLSVKYIFTQAKFTDSWDYGEALKFTRAVDGFFKDSDIGSSSRVNDCREMHSHIIEKYTGQLDNSPQIFCYYVDTKQDSNEWKRGQKAMDELQRDLKALGLFYSIQTKLVDAPQLQELYRKSRNSAEAQITFSSRVTLPKISGVDQAYIGVLPVKELLTLLTDEGHNESDSKEIKRSIFEDNVRDFQGIASPVNNRMQQTLTSEHNERFAVMNNGITIVTRDLNVKGDQFALKGYQIVNGAQTSHVIFSNSESLVNSEVRVPIKLVQTQDEDVITAIVTATNSQTQIKMDQLNARAIAERNIEKYFAAQEIPRNLLYERRAKQYDSQTNVVKARVIDRYTLVRSVAATFLEEPHLATGYPQQLMSRIVHPLEENTKHDSLTKPRKQHPIFEDNYQPVVYYAAASAYYKLDLLFKTGKIDPRFKPARWHMLALARQLTLPDSIPSFIDKKFDRWVSPFLDDIWDEEKALIMFLNTTSIISDSGLELSRSALRNTNSVEELKQSLQAHISSTEGVARS